MLKRSDEEQDSGARLFTDVTAGLVRVEREKKRHARRTIRRIGFALVLVLVTAVSTLAGWMMASHLDGSNPWEWRQVIEAVRDEG